MLKLVIDPGHGGKDPGAIGNGLKEKDLNLDISKRVSTRLSLYDVEVLLTRNIDTDLELDECAKIANDLEANYYCSIHTNAGGGTGFESYIYNDAASETERIRTVIHNKIAAYYKNAGFIDRGKKIANFYVLRETSMPAILLENLFIDNKKDAVKLKNTTFLEGLATAIVNGLVDALQIPLKTQVPIESPGQTQVKIATAVPFQSRAYLLANNPKAPDYVDIYFSMGSKYGIRWDAVLAQSCKETAFWRFGGSVKPEQNNFAGLAALSGKKGATFATPAEGIEAQFQHWHVYYYGGDLPTGSKFLDPRRNAVLKSGWAGTLQYVEDLGGKWAPAKDYGSSIVKDYLMKMLGFAVSKPEPSEAPAPAWDPALEIAKLKADRLINSDHQPDDQVLWGEMATVINRLRGK